MDLIRLLHMVTLTTGDGQTTNLVNPFCTFPWGALYHFPVPKWMKLLAVCVIVVFDTYGWLVEKLLGWKRFAVIRDWCPGVTS
ncbi:hypothetical protein OIU85_014847 [Salix viminalis]|uniref:Uncharacterized protein n=1 Tax=Salix viminalis TaxID=40686 RepID=A0A9Q0SBN5_SALVM|nr:hypothetical protein OIU85_014847 [Salix viminalis]